MTPQDRIERVPEDVRQELRTQLALLREAELGHRQAEQRFAVAVDKAAEAGVSYRDIGEVLGVAYASIFQLTKRALPARARSAA